LLGRHQHQNVGAALAALEQSGFAIPAFAVRSGVRSIDWPARAQQLKKGLLIQALPWSWEVYLDGGHNAGGGLAIAELIDDYWRDRPLHLVAGMLMTKAAEDFLAPLVTRAVSLTAVPVPGHTAAYAPEALAEVARRLGFASVGVGASPLEGVLRAKALTPAQGRVLICGSLYLAGEVLKENS
jgi:dihydrofolate synthase/folylpolyglutamate synthase